MTRVVLVVLGVALVWPDVSVVIRLVCVALFVADHIAWQMFKQAKDTLKEGGELRIIGNRHLASRPSLYQRNRTSCAVFSKYGT